MKKLYMIGLGGSIKNANTEVHAMQFVYAENLEDCYQELKKRWYGESLHIDGYMYLKTIDGYEVDFSNKMEDNLYMIVYGGYQEDVIDEIHRYHFVVAKSKTEAKLLAKESMHSFTSIDHVDEVVDVFENAGVRFGLKERDCSFSENSYSHTFIKLK